MYIYIYIYISFAAHNNLKINFSSFSGSGATKRVEKSHKKTTKKYEKNFRASD